MNVRIDTQLDFLNMVKSIFGIAGVPYKGFVAKYGHYAQIRKYGFSI